MSFFIAANEILTLFAPYKYPLRINSLTNVDGNAKHLITRILCHNRKFQPQLAVNVLKQLEKLIFFSFF